MAAIPVTTATPAATGASSPSAAKIPAQPTAVAAADREITVLTKTFDSFPSQTDAIKNAGGDPLKIDAVHSFYEVAKLASRKQEIIGEVSAALAACTSSTSNDAAQLQRKLTEVKGAQKEVADSVLALKPLLSLACGTYMWNKNGYSLGGLTYYNPLNTQSTVIRDYKIFRDKEKELAAAAAAAAASSDASKAQASGGGGGPVAVDAKKSEASEKEAASKAAKPVEAPASKVIATPTAPTAVPATAAAPASVVTPAVAAVSTATAPAAAVTAKAATAAAASAPVVVTTVTSAPSTAAAAAPSAKTAQPAAAATTATPVKRQPYNPSELETLKGHQAELTTALADINGKKPSGKNYSTVCETVLAYLNSHTPDSYGMGPAHAFKKAWNKAYADLSELSQHLESNMTTDKKTSK